MKITDKEKQKIYIGYQQEMIKDGWTIKPTYKTESIDTAATLEKEGFIATFITRFKNNRYESCLDIWGPDGLDIKPPMIYSWDKIKEGVSICGYCYDTDVPTRRIGFAERCCEKCYPRQKALIETPGWYN